MIDLYSTLLLNDRAQAIPADICKINKQTPVIDRVLEYDVPLMIILLSTDSNLCLEFYKYLYFFFDLMFSSLK